MPTGLQSAWDNHLSPVTNKEAATMQSERLGTTRATDNPLVRLRVYYVVATAAVAIVLAVIGLIGPYIPEEILPETMVTQAAIVQIVFIVVASIVIGMVRQGYAKEASWLLVGLLTVMTITLDSNYSLLLVLATLTIVSAAILGNRLTYWLVNIALIARGAHFIYLMYYPDVVSESSFEKFDFWVIVATLAVVDVTVRVFIHSAEHAAQEAQRSRGVLQATADIGQIVAKLLDLNELFPRAVELIRDRFAFYHVQIFLVDENGEYANLVASTGEAGQRLLERGHQLAVGSQSVIGRVTQLGEPVSVVDTDPVHSRNELLPNTRSELALPITDGEKIIGALDVQSTRRFAFGDTDIRALQVMASQLGISIRNARLFEGQEASLQENKRLFLASEANLREIQRLNQQLTKSAWMDYLEARQAPPGIALKESQLTTDVPWTDIMVQTSQRRRPINDTSDPDKPVVAVPIMLKGEVLGAIEVESTDGASEADTVEMVQAIAERLANSLERARLFEDAQETSSIQQYINEIVGHYQSAGTVDDLLQITVTELSEALGAKHAAIRLGSVQTREKQNGDMAP
jgi:GAF domain-containing protein